MASKQQERRERQRQATKDSAPETSRGEVEGPTIADPEEQARIEALLAQQERSVEATTDVTEQLKTLPAEIRQAVKEGMVEARITEETVKEAVAPPAPAAPQKDEIKEEVKEGVKEGMKEAVEKGRGRIKRAGRETWNVLKPRKPVRSDIAPVVYSNLGSWGGAYVLSQMVPGASDFLVDLFSQE